MNVQNKQKKIRILKKRYLFLLIAYLINCINIVAMDKKLILAGLKCSLGYGFGIFISNFLHKKPIFYMTTQSCLPSEFCVILLIHAVSIVCIKHQKKISYILVNFFVPNKEASSEQHCFYISILLNNVSEENIMKVRNIIDNTRRKNNKAILRYYYSAQPQSLSQMILDNPDLLDKPCHYGIKPHFIIPINNRGEGFGLTEAKMVIDDLKQEFNKQNIEGVGSSNYPFATRPFTDVIFAAFGDINIQMRSQKFYKKYSDKQGKWKLFNNNLFYDSEKTLQLEQLFKS